MPIDDDLEARLDAAAASLQQAAASLRGLRRPSAEAERRLNDASAKIEAARRLLAQLETQGP